MVIRIFLALFLFCLWAILNQVLTPWLSFSGAGILLFLGLILNLYPDKFLLHFLQARETIERDYPEAYQLVRAQAYKLKISSPRIYFYSGFFQRAFAFTSNGRLTFVLEKRTFETATDAELEALFFALTLQAQQGFARNHTWGLLGVSLLWVLPLKLVKNPKRISGSLSWLIQFFVSPLSHFVFQMAYPRTVWSKFSKSMSGFPRESLALRELNSKSRAPNLSNDPVKQLNYRLMAASHSSAEQMILALEGMHHPFDGFGVQELQS